MKIQKLFLVYKDDEPFAAYPREIQSEVYASGISDQSGVNIVEGVFIPLSLIEGAISRERIE